jgi:enoyl-CoA hydratase/carnithine racemase
MKAPQYETIEVVKPSQYIWHVRFNRPKKLNAMNRQFFADLKKCFEDVNKDEEARVVILTGNGKHFCAGLDLMDYGSTFNFEDVGGTDDPTQIRHEPL